MGLSKRGTRVSTKRKGNRGSSKIKKSKRNSSKRGKRSLTKRGKRGSSKRGKRRVSKKIIKGLSKNVMKGGGILDDIQQDIQTCFTNNINNYIDLLSN